MTLMEGQMVNRYGTAPWSKPIKEWERSVKELNAKIESIKIPLPVLFGSEPKQQPPQSEELSRFQQEIAVLKTLVVKLEKNVAELHEKVSKVANASDTQTLVAHADPTKTKGERQEEAILYWVKRKGYDPLNIPDTEKKTIRVLCETESETQYLFDAKFAFDEAWKRLRKKNLVRLTGHESYVRKHRNRG